jgi:hypothetical protein
MNFSVFRNIALNLHAKGPAAVIIALIAAVAVVSVFGTEGEGRSGMLLLWFVGAAVVAAMGSHAR